jgi:branched-chain amino acid transport system permease protein
VVRPARSHLRLAKTGSFVANIGNAAGQAPGPDIVEGKDVHAGASWPWRHTLLVAAAAGIALLFMPYVLSAYPLIIFCHMLVLAIACLGFNLLFGTTGLLSLGHAAYFGVAAYAGTFLYRFSFVESFELYFLFGAVTSTLFAAVIGFLCVRTTRIFFAILTLAFSMVVYSFVIDGAIFRLFGDLGWSLYLLGGGSLYLPRLTFLGTRFPPGEFVFALYAVIAVTLMAVALLLARIGSSPFGLALRAIRDNETRAALIGIPVWRYRWYAFILSGFITGLAGAFYGQLARQITPEQLYWLFSAEIVLATVLGGTRYFLGPVLGAFAFVGLNEVATQWTFGRSAMLGLLLILVIRIAPGGIAGGIAALVSAVNRFRSARKPAKA